MPWNRSIFGNIWEHFLHGLPGFPGRTKICKTPKGRHCVGFCHCQTNFLSKFKIPHPFCFTDYFWKPQFIKTLFHVEIFQDSFRNGHKLKLPVFICLPWRCELTSIYGNRARCVSYFSSFFLTMVVIIGGTCINSSVFCEYNVWNTLVPKKFQTKLLTWFPNVFRHVNVCLQKSSVLTHRLFFFL